MAIMAAQFSSEGMTSQVAILTPNCFLGVSLFPVLLNLTLLIHSLSPYLSKRNFAIEDNWNDKDIKKDKLLIDKASNSLTSFVYKYAKYACVCFSFISYVFLFLKYSQICVLSLAWSDMHL